MTTCMRIREELPWYITGSIELKEAERIAEHLRGCPECRSEFAEAALARCRYGEMMAKQAGPTPAVWERLEERIGGATEGFRVDVGSLMLGLRLGISAGQRRQPVRGELHVLGKRLPIIGSRKKGA